MGYLSHMASGITWAADRGAKVANLSFAGVGGFATVQSAAQYMKNKGGVVVTAAGNYGTVETFAASDSNIVVSATDSNDVKASWSSYGEFVDVAAPGTGIWTTTRGGGYSAVSGTSVASPVTAGVVALMMAANPAIGPADIEKLLFSTALDLGSAGFDTYYGRGRINAQAAVQAAASARASDTAAPTVSITNPAAGSTVSGLITVDVAASDNIGVSRVELLANGKLVASDNSAPFGFSWGTTTVADGSATLTAYAYDAAGNSASRAVQVTVANATSAAPSPTPSEDSLAPVARISNPGQGALVSGNVSVLANATDNVGVKRLQLYINNKLVSSANGSSLNYRWNTSKIAKGTYTIVLDAFDAAGNKGSQAIQVVR